MKDQSNVVQSVDAENPVVDATTEPKFQITSLAELQSSVNEAASTVSEKPQRMYNKTGFKGLEGLEGLSNESLATMSAACQRQIAINGGDNVVILLGEIGKNGKLAPGVLGQFGPAAVAEAVNECKLASYLVVATDLGIKREKGEAAGDFINRVTHGMSQRTV